ALGRYPEPLHQPAIWGPGAVCPPRRVRAGRRLPSPAVDGRPGVVTPTAAPGADLRGAGPHRGVRAALPAQPTARHAAGQRLPSAVSRGRFPAATEAAVPRSALIARDLAKPRGRLTRRIKDSLTALGLPPRCADGSGVC